MRAIATMNGFFTLTLFACLFKLASQSSPEPAGPIAQADQLSVLDPVAMSMHNLSDPMSADNDTDKVPLIEEEATQAEEKKDSLAIFFILFVLVLCILVVHVLITTEFHYMPESLAIVLLGAFIGLILSYSKWDWREVETFNPNFFFLVLLPPIIFESGYTLNKGNFFANIVPILIFAIIGTAITAFFMGACIFALGQLDVIYKLSALEAFAFGSMISAVDPVVTLAIFQALKVDAQLYMLAFGESMLNDAVSIVLATTALEMSSDEFATLSSIEMTEYALFRFLSMFFVSALLGAAVGFISALLFKHIDLRKTPSLEFALLIIFAYLPYGLAEAISLSGIMAILFCAITMSQYTHFNISSITQVTTQQTFRMLPFVAGIIC
jgi:sodium/hydrogen exchanger 8